jgi:hypothetical protein
MFRFRALVFGGHWCRVLTPPQFQPINTKDGVTDTHAKV